MTDSDVRLNEESNRFELVAAPDRAFIDYRSKPGEIFLVHTEVADDLGGKGYAKALAKYALDYAREKGLKVHPWCPFIVTYIKRHPEYADLVAE